MRVSATRCDRHRLDRESAVTWRQTAFDLGTAGVLNNDFRPPIGGWSCVAIAGDPGPPSVQGKQPQSDPAGQAGGPLLRVGASWVRVVDRWAFSRREIEWSTQNAPRYDRPLLSRLSSRDSLASCDAGQSQIRKVWESQCMPITSDLRSTAQRRSSQLRTLDCQLGRCRSPSARRWVRSEPRTCPALHSNTSLGARRSSRGQP